MTEKSEIKAAAAHELGVKLDDKLESVRADLLRHEGGKMALDAAAVAVESLAAHVDRDVSEGVYDIDVAKFVKRYITRAVGGLKNLSLRSEGEQVQARGVIRGLEEAVAMAKKYMDSERAKLAAQEASRREVVALLATAGGDDGSSRHPGDPMAARRAENKGNGVQHATVRRTRKKRAERKTTTTVKKNVDTDLRRKKALALRKGDG